MLEVTRAISVAILWLSLAGGIALAWNSIPIRSALYEGMQTK